MHISFRTADFRATILKPRTGTCSPDRRFMVFFSFSKKDLVRCIFHLWGDEWIRHLWAFSVVIEVPFIIQCKLTPFTSKIWSKWKDRRLQRSLLVCVKNWPDIKRTGSFNINTKYSPHYPWIQCKTFFGFAYVQRWSILQHWLCGTVLQTQRSLEVIT